MTLVEGLTIAVLFVGPVAAILVSLWAERRRETRSRKSNAVRLFLVGRLNLAEPSFQQAINTIPVDFADDDRVLAALEAYLEATAIPWPVRTKRALALLANVGIKRSQLSPLRC